MRVAEKGVVISTERITGGMRDTSDNHKIERRC